MNTLAKQREKDIELCMKYGEFGRLMRQMVLALPDDEINSWKSCPLHLQTYYCRMAKAVREAR